MVIRLGYNALDFTLLNVSGNLVDGKCFIRAGLLFDLEKHHRNDGNEQQSVDDQRLIT
jgi:hypothetical protein